MNPLAALWRLANGPKQDRPMSPEVLKVRQYSKDHAEANERSRLRALPRPKLTKGESGTWWCASTHKTPQFFSPTGIPIFVRVGCGDTPQEAYRSWENF